MPDARRIITLHLPLLSLHNQFIHSQLIAPISSTVDNNIQLVSAFMFESEDFRCTTRPPRPVQGGERITEAWLRSLTDRECLWQFRMTADELLDLTEAIGIPDQITTPGAYTFSSIEALCLTCARFRSSGDIYELCTKFNRSQSSISEIVNFVVIYIDENWKHLLEFDHAHLLSRPNLEKYARAVHEAGLEAYQPLQITLENTYQRKSTVIPWQLVHFPQYLLSTPAHHGDEGPGHGLR
ncbi:hypothetical protein BJ138DRAFT_1183994 [Hygrophoropsis aurantiaca]|uniref:Uncharacterized protein n=1 Tax=Hygrophoropsis aurantiaca TaxID=72124 RepID=A0ACB7ZVB3_9AGAM|nr:hypothetical protein BJ138DRAFT_1183994 [Hygrophoropsis aurantiaca]